MEKLTLYKNKKIYFASDMHLGLPNFEESLKREKLFVKWLDEIKKDAQEIYLLGDIFDFWHEWKYVVPRGFTRFLGKIAELTDSGIPIHLFTGNHDIWIYDYLPQETGVILHRNEYLKLINNKKFYMAHGDGLGPNDFSFKFLKKIFTNKILQWFFARIHPNFSMWFGFTWSSGRRHYKSYIKDYGPEKEWLVQHSREVLKERHFDYFVYGHRHIPRVYELEDNSTFINLGDWLKNFTYGVFDGDNFSVKKYEKCLST